MGAELFHLEGRTDGRRERETDMMELVAAAPILRRCLKYDIRHVNELLKTYFLLTRLLFLRGPKGLLCVVTGRRATRPSKLVSISDSVQIVYALPATSSQDGRPSFPGSQAGGG